MALVGANNGGCWFCQKDDHPEDMRFTCEWDSYFHRRCCLIEYLRHNPEAEVIYREFHGFRED